MRIADSKSRPANVVYTAITGGKDELAEPEVVAPGWDHVCFTDDPRLESRTWEIRPLELDEPDPSRRARRPKVLAHHYLPEYSVSLWIDGNMTLRGSPDEFARRHLGAGSLALFRHPDAQRGVYEEGEACVRLRKDDPETIAAQLERYRAEGIPPTHLVAATGVLLRRHREAPIAALAEEWWREIELGSVRDQIALAAVIWRRQPELARIDDDIRDNPLVLWRPHLDRMGGAGGR